MRALESFVMGAICIGAYAVGVAAYHKAPPPAPCEHVVDVLICDTPTEKMHALDDKVYGKTSFQCEIPAKVMKP